MLDSLKVEVQQYRGSWWGPGRFRQQLLDKVQRLRAQEAAVEVSLSACCMSVNLYHMLLCVPVCAVCCMLAQLMMYGC